MASFQKGKRIERPKSDQVPLHEANRRQREIDEAARKERHKVANVAHAAIDAAFRPKSGARKRVQKSLRAAPR
jgi:hypothetical protein